jgi:hypothetical protein
MNETNGPNFFVIGAARSGTTGLAEMLRQHPDLFITQPKEPHFLALAEQELAFTGPGDDVMINRYGITDPDAYFALYRDAGGRAARGDASVSSLYYPDATLASLERYAPGARLVVIFREPVARAFSAYSYLRVRGHEPCDDFLDAIRQEQDGLRAGWHHIWHYVGMGQYARQLRPFLEQLGPERIQVLFYDDMVRDPIGVARQVLDFLGLDTNVEIESELVNSSGRPRSQLVQQSIRWVARRPRVKAAVESTTPYRLRERIKRANLGQQSPPGGAGEVLGDLFASEIAELGELLAEYYTGRVDTAPAWLAHVAVASETAAK